MKTIRSILLVVALLLAATPAHDQSGESADEGAGDLEVQLNAFKTYSEAYECKKSLGDLSRPVYISKLNDPDGTLFYTVRTGPFETVARANTFINDLPLRPDLSPWIMQEDSLQPAWSRTGKSKRKASAAGSRKASEKTYEVQLGAFKLKSMAEKGKADYDHLDVPVYISKLENKEGAVFHTVRTGPFPSIKQARDFIRALDDPKGDRPWIMYKDRLIPAWFERKDQPGDSSGDERIAQKTPEREDGRPEPAVSSEEPDRKVTSSPSPASEEKEAETAPEPDAPAQEKAQDQEESGGGLWGVSKEAPSETEEGAEPAAGPRPTAAGASSKSVNALQRQVEELQDQVQTLMDAEEVRSKLEATEEEKEEKEEDILSAAGRNYTLLPKGRLGVEYKLDYTYFAYDALREQNIIEHNSNHNLTNTFTVEFPLKNNLSLETAIPFVYEYDRVAAEDSRDVSDFGDVDFAVNYQPVKSGGGFPSLILRTVFTAPMGRDPYDINPETELSTGSGGYSAEGSLSVSKAVDPVIVFGTLSYTYKHPIKDLDYKLGSQTLVRYDRGDTVGFSMGLGYSLSYITSLSLGFNYAYSFEAKRYFKEAEPREYPTRTDASLFIGTSWRLTQKLRLSSTVQMGLSNSDYFTLSFRFPYEFAL